MFEFANRDILYWLGIIPVLVIIFWVSRIALRKALKTFGDWEVVNQLMDDISFKRPVFKYMFLMLAAISLVIGIAGPQVGSKLQETKREGVEMVIALDVSNSMLAEDIQPNRLERAKQAISKLLDNLNHDRIGLIVFAGEAYVQLPMTTDYAAAKMILSTIMPGVVPTQGTAIGDRKSVV